MDFRKTIKNYIPRCEQEEKDKDFFIRFIDKNPDCLLRSNDFAHITASSWVVNSTRQKVLMVYHNIYDSWSWTGGHADGESDLAALALKELTEETGLSAPRLLSPSPVSIEILTVDGHIKRGEYVHSHLHLNATYLFEADEDALTKVKEDENSGVGWFTLDEMFDAVSEKWMAENIYKKLCLRAKEY